MPRADEATFTPAQIAQRYGVTTATVAAWIAAGELKAVNVSRSAKSKKPRYRITATALEAFEASRTPTVPAPPGRRRRRAESDVIEFIR